MSSAVRNERAPIRFGGIMAKVFVTDSSYDADIKVSKASSEYDADLKVFVVGSEYEATSDGLWCYVDSSGQATSKITWVESGGDLKVFFVDSSGQAGWNGGNAWQMRL